MHNRRLSIGAFVVAIGLLSAPLNAACRQALALGLDVSGSVDAKEYRLQFDGLANALDDYEIRTALFAMPSAPISLLIYEWSGPNDQNIVLDWYEINDGKSLSRVIEILRTTRRAKANPSTAIGSAIVVGLHFLNQRPDCWTKTLDISGDGISNTGPHPRDGRTMANSQNITINALAIGTAQSPRKGTRQLDNSGLASYFRTFVIAGPDAFVETALGFANFEEAMTRKLKKELQGLALSLNMKQ